MFTKKLYILIVLLLAGPAASASSNLYYGALRAESAPAAGGRVYAGVAPRTDSLATAMTSANQSTETMDGEVVFYAYAQASSGWSFAGWSSAPDGAVTRTENPLAVSVACRAKNENVPTTDTVFALFRELQSTMLTLETPTLLDGTAGGGSYTAQFSDGTNITVTDQARSHATGGTVTLTAQPAQGMKFFGWKIEPLSLFASLSRSARKLDCARPAGTLSPKRARETDANDGRWQIQATQHTAEYISYSDTLRNYGFAEDCSIRAVFVSKDTPLFSIKGKFDRYADLDAAIAQSQLPSPIPAVVALVSGGTLRGSHTIPQEVTLLVPFDKQLSCYREAPVTVYSRDALWSDNHEYIQLTLAQDASLIVRGELSISAKLRSGKGNAACGCVDGAYGRIDLQEGAEITLQDTAKLYCWGFITGRGIVNATNGTTIYESFHFPYSRGGNATNSIAGSKKHVFPINQYYIQNVEAPLTLQSNASLQVFTTMSIDSTLYRATAPYIGQRGLFRPQEGTTIRKHYDPALDRQIYDIYGDAEFTQMELNIGGYLLNSEVYVMPITNNMDIRLHSGTTTVQHQLALLAGASITIDEDATLRLKDSTFVYDKDEWLVRPFEFNAYLHTTVNSPDVTFVRDTANLTDAKLDVNGTLLVDSAFYTTKGGANICSTKGTGRIIFNHISPAADTTWQAVQDSTAIYFYAIPCTAPKLRNAERYAHTGAEYLLTGGARQLAISNEQLAIGGVQPGDTIYAHNGHWGWLRSFEDERSNDYRPDGELSMSKAQMSVAQGQIDGGTSYPRESAHGGHHLPQTEASQINEQLAISNEQLSRSSERAVYAAVCALREEDLPELPFDTEHFVPERTISTGEACVFLGWTDAERDEANQQIITYATWECPEEPVDAIEEIEIGGNKEQETRNKKILRDGEIIIIMADHEYNIMGIPLR